MSQATHNPNNFNPYNLNQSTINHKFIKYDSPMLNQIYGTKDVTPYWIADMDFPIASPISQAMQQLVDRQSYSYEFDSKSVFNAISRWNMERHGLELTPEHRVQHAAHGTQHKCIAKRLNLKHKVIHAFKLRGIFFTQKIIVTELV
jgi:hypothetical protein